jgi:hypothetical protein
VDARCKSLIFLNDEGTNLELINLDGVGRRPILKNTRMAIAAASVSPDGQEVCYIAYPQQAYDGVLYRARIDGVGEP